jgi:hypothetical protein
MRLVAVLGYSARRPNGLHAVCEARIRHAQEIAEDGDVILLSGEVEEMQSAWSGEAELDPHAMNTRQNAAGVAAAARRLGADEVVVVTSGWHALRARTLVRAALGDGIPVSSSSPPGPRPKSLLARELVCLTALPLHAAELARARQRGE